MRREAVSRLIAAEQLKAAPTLVSPRTRARRTRRNSYEGGSLSTELRGRGRLLSLNVAAPRTLAIRGPRSLDASRLAPGPLSSPTRTRNRAINGGESA